MLLTDTSFWLNGNWYDAPASPVIKDIDGNVVNIGDDVNIPMTITGIIYDNSQYGRAIVQAKYGPKLIFNTSSLNLVKV